MEVLLGEAGVGDEVVDVVRSVRDVDGALGDERGEVDDGVTAAGLVLREAWMGAGVGCVGLVGVVVEWVGGG